MADAPRLADLPLFTTYLVLGDAASAVPFGHAVRDDSGALVVGRGPEEWLLLGGPTGVGRPGLKPSLEGAFVTVIDVSHGHSWVRLSGDRAADLLAKVCAIDLGDGITPNGAAFRSSVAKVVTDVVRDDVGSADLGGMAGGATRSYLLGCDASLGQYLRDALLDAGAEFGIVAEFATEN